MQTVGLLVNKIPGLVDFGNRMSASLGARGIALRGLGTCRYDVYSEGEPGFPIDYLSDELFSEAPPALTPSERLYAHKHLDQSLLWPDTDRYIAFGMRLPPAFRRPDIGERLFAFFLRAIERYGIDLLLCELPSNAFGLAAYHAARSIGAAFLSIHAGRMGARTELLLDPLRPQLEFARLYRTAAFGTEELSAARQYIETIDRQQLEYVVQSSFNPGSLVRKYASSTKLRHFFGEVRAARRFARPSGYSLHWERPVYTRWAYLRRSIRRQWRISRLRGFFKAHLPEEPFLLYPIHFHPEASTSVFGIRFQNELHAISRIASSLPFGMRLVVKDHMHALGHEPLRQYRALETIPGVVLLDPAFNIKVAIRASRGVVTNTGTAGFEALAIGRPVFLLGNAVYDYVPWCHKIDDPEEITAKLRDPSVGPEPEECVRFVASYLRGTIPGVFNFLRHRASPGIEERIADEISATLASPDHPVS